MLIAALASYRGQVGFTQPGRRFNKCIEHGLQIEGRAADNLEHVGSGGLLLERFTQLIKQTRVFDSDDGLRSEVLDQLDLLVSEGTNFLPIDGYSTDHLVVLQHRYRDQSPGASKVDGGFAQIVPIRWGRCYIGKSGNLLCPNQRAQARLWPRVEDSTAHKVNIGSRGAMRCSDAEGIGIPFAQPEKAEFGAANSYRILQHGVEDRLKLAGRGANNFQHFGGRDFALARLVKLAADLAKFILQVCRGCVLNRCFARLGPRRAPPLHWQSASTASLHVATQGGSPGCSILGKFSLSHHGE